MTSAGSTSPEWSLEWLEWDSAFWERRVARVLPPTPARSTPLSSDLLHDCDLAYLLVEAGETELIGSAEAQGFRVVDIRCEVALDAPGTSPTPPTTAIRPAADGELSDVAALAATSHLNTRFGSDSQLDRERVAHMYRLWIARDRERPGWALRVAARDGRVAGYVSHGPDGEGNGTLGLIAVHPEMRGIGIGRELLSSAVAAEHAAGRPTMRVVTQGASSAALAMYQAAGFKVARLSVWLHWHRP